MSPIIRYSLCSWQCPVEIRGLVYDSSGSAVYDFGKCRSHIAHLGGALAGWCFSVGLRKGTDWTKWINKTLDVFSTGWKPSARKPKMKVHYGEKQKDYDFNARKKASSEEIDRILDKLRKSGYGSLSEEEKKSLFDASKK